MKKIFFLLLIVLSFNLLGYEYIIYNVRNGEQVRIFYDNNNRLLMKYLSNGVITNSNLSPGNTTFWTSLSGVKNNKVNYTKYNDFNNYLKNDLQFLNDMYIQATQQFLNYLYNSNEFSLYNHISYEDYEIFYNEDGLAVESKIDGIYKGLYDDIGQSGILYNSVGEVVLIDGVEPSFLTKQWLKLQNKIINPLLSVFSISNIWKNILCVVVILASLRMLIRYAFKAFLIRLYSKRIKHYENTITRIENA